MQSSGTATLHRVLLLKDGSVNKARPAFLAVAPGDQVRFVNHTQAVVAITFTGGVFEQPTVQLEAGTGAKSPDLTVVSSVTGRYPYTGTVGGGQIVIQGESSPEIIIDGQ